MLCAKTSPRGRLSFPGGTPYHGLFGEVPPGRDTFLRLQVYKRVGISIVEEYDQKGLTDHFMDTKETRNLPGLLIYSY